MKRNPKRSLLAVACAAAVAAGAVAYAQTLGQPQPDPIQAIVDLIKKQAGEAPRPVPDSQAGPVAQGFPGPIPFPFPGNPPPQPVPAPPPGYGGEVFELYCESGHDYGRRECYVNSYNPIAFAEVYQISRAACTQGVSYGWNARYVWVDHGCRARFVVHTYQGQLVRTTVLCESGHDDGHRECYAGVRYIVDVGINQISRAACKAGESWGYGPTNVWVDHGCRAYFYVTGYQ